MRQYSINDIINTLHISIHAPLAGCDFGKLYYSITIIYFNPRTPCGVRLVQISPTYVRTAISIHAPLAGCDPRLRRVYDKMGMISIHAPLAGCDLVNKYFRVFVVAFQSTHPLRGATHIFFASRLKPTISIHAPLAGCDSKIIKQLRHLAKFQSTHPLRGATGHIRHRNTIQAIFQSTHPLRGATISCQCLAHGTDDFNPRTPCGVRQIQAPPGCPHP